MWQPCLLPLYCCGHIFQCLYSQDNAKYFPVVVTHLPESASVNPAGTCLIVISRAPRLSTVRSVKRRVTATGIPEPSVIPWTAPVSVQGDIWEIGTFVFVLCTLGHAGNELGKGLFILVQKRKQQKFTVAIAGCEHVRWVHRESYLIFTLDSVKDQSKRFAFLFAFA